MLCVSVQFMGSDSMHACMYVYARVSVDVCMNDYNDYNCMQVIGMSVCGCLSVCLPACLSASLPVCARLFLFVSVRQSLFSTSTCVCPFLSSARHQGSAKLPNHQGPPHCQSGLWRSVKNRLCPPQLAKYIVQV